jgi:hypothetical protein
MSRVLIYGAAFFNGNLFKTQTRTWIPTLKKEITRAWIIAARLRLKI